MVGGSAIDAIDWQYGLPHCSFIIHIQLTASGATEKINYSLSGGVYQQDGIVYGFSYNRYTLCANHIEAQTTDCIRVGLTVAPSYGVQKGPSGRKTKCRYACTSRMVSAKPAENAGADPYSLMVSGHGFLPTTVFSAMIAN